MTRRAWLVVGVILSALLLAGCGGQPTVGGSGSSTRMHTRSPFHAVGFWAESIDGRKIPCLITAEGGLSCDWSAR